MSKQCPESCIYCGATLKNEGTYCINCGILQALQDKYLSMPDVDEIKEEGND